MPEYAIHPFCEAMPRMSKADYARRLALYKKHPHLALDQTVLLYPDLERKAKGEVKILDGRHHYQICKELGYEFLTDVFPGTRVQAIALVEARGDGRRHTTETQRAASAVRIAQLYATGEEPEGDEPAARPVVTQAEAAEKYHTSERTIRRVKRAAEADPRLLDLMTDGTFDAMTAEKVAKLPEDARERVLSAADPAKAARKALAAARPVKGPKKEKPAAPAEYREKNDHPFADLLDMFTALAGEVTKAIAGPGGKRIEKYLLLIQKGNPPHPPLIEHRSEIVNGKRYGSIFTALRGLRRVIKLAGMKTEVSDKAVYLAYKTAGEE